MRRFFTAVKLRKREQKKPGEKRKRKGNFRRFLNHFHKKTHRFILATFDAFVAQIPSNVSRWPRTRGQAPDLRHPAGHQRLVLILDEHRDGREVHVHRHDLDDWPGEVGVGGRAGQPVVQITPVDSLQEELVSHDAVLVVEHVEVVVDDEAVVAPGHPGRGSPCKQRIHG